MRVRPAFGKKYQPDCYGCIFIPVAGVIGYFICTSILRVVGGNGSRLDQAICIVALIGLVIFIILALRDENRKEILDWKRTCKYSEVAIMSRGCSREGWYDDGNEIRHVRPIYHLDLDPNADQRATYPHIKVIRVDVFSRVYARLQERNTVSIYYKSENPLIFMLEEELS